MISRRSSGSRRAESAVDPTRSQNITVSWRRSAEESGTAGVRDAGVGDSEVDAPAEVSFAPQSPQNLALDGLRLPQDGHDEGIGAPHSMQKRLPCGSSVRQLGHSMAHPTFRVDQPTTEA